jgi:hypothetical protein
MPNNLFDRDFLGSVEKYTGNSLQRKEDVKRIIQTVITDSKEAEFDNLIFTSKYICGLIRVLKNSPGIPEVNSTEHIKKDLNENIKKGVEYLNEIVSGDDKDLKNYFNEKYTFLTPENFINLQKLFSDLEAVKKYLNYLKRLS